MPTVGGIPPTPERQKEINASHGSWMALGGGNPELMRLRAADETLRQEFWTGNSKKKGEPRSKKSGIQRRVWRQPKHRKNGGQFAPKPDYEK
jgi:hypothetical protein